MWRRIYGLCVAEWRRRSPWLLAHLVPVLSPRRVSTSTSKVCSMSLKIAMFTSPRTACVLFTSFPRVSVPMHRTATALSNIRLSLSCRVIWICSSPTSPRPKSNERRSLIPSMAGRRRRRMRAFNTTANPIWILSMP